jgi:hypothetical protein
MTNEERDSEADTVAASDCRKNNVIGEARN